MSHKKTRPVTGKFCVTLILPENGNSLHGCGMLQFSKQHFYTQAPLVTHIWAAPERVLESSFGDCRALCPLIVNGKHNMPLLVQELQPITQEHKNPFNV